MGQNASSDEWCCQSDVLIQGIPWAKKIVDDMLIWAEDMNQLNGENAHNPKQMQRVQPNFKEET